MYRHRGKNVEASEGLFAPMFLTVLCGPMVRFSASWLTASMR